MSFWIVTDGCCDLPESYISRQKQITIVPLTYQVDGVSYESSLDETKLLHLYDLMREGGTSTTAQINESTWKDYLTIPLEAGHDVLCVVFSSGLSGTFDASRQAVETLKVKYPERSLATVDTLAASLGEGLLVDAALRCRDERGMSLEQTRDWLEENKLRVAQWFTVEDLRYLRRGGRVSAASAIIAGALKIKPVLHVDNEGKLISMDKVQGRKRSLRAVVSHIRSSAVNIEEQTIFISHGDCQDDAFRVADLIKEEFPVKDVLISMVGPIIGTHSGPGTIAVFWFANER